MTETESTQRNLLYALEGVIGVGKSTLLKELAKRGLIVREEQVDHWTLLKSLYADAAKFAFSFQLQVLASYADLGDDVQVVERSSESALGVFVKMLASQGSLSKNETQTLDQVFDLLPTRKVDKIIFLDLPLDECQARLQQRGRAGEAAVSMQYLTDIEAQYKIFLQNATVPVHTVRMSSDTSVEDLADQVEAIVKAGV